MLRAFLIIVCLLLGLPILASLALLGLGLVNSVWIAAVVWNIMSMMGMVDTMPQKSEWNVVNLRNDKRFGDRTPATEAYRAIVEPKRIIPVRSVRFNALVAPEDVPGSRGTTLDFENAVRLHAPTLAAEECERMKLWLADQCVVEMSRVISRSERLFSVEMQLNFTMKDDFGVVPERTPLMIAPIDQRLIEGGPQGRLITRSSQVETRAGMYRRAMETCRQIRSSRGNCAVISIEMRAQPERGSVSTMRMSGQAVMAFLHKQ
jgi:hypothetical protein